MSVSRRRVAGVAALSAAVAGLATQPSLRAFVSKWTGLGYPGGGWRLLAIVLLITNFKNIPFIWHFRFFGAFFYQLYFQPTSIPPHALFQPAISATRTTLMETDYNMHKSNSTYFADMDMSRTHLFVAILRRGILKHGNVLGRSRSEKVHTSPGKTYPALGAISCFFKREIPPFQKYEMWTRLLCWDRKWFYMVTHLVKTGVAKPAIYTLQPWKKGKVGKEHKRVNGEEKEYQEKVNEKLKNAVYATAISRYVLKRGRITVYPEEALIGADMLPDKPEGWVYKGDDEGFVADDVLPPLFTEENWNWDTIEAERRRGLRFAEAFDSLEGLHQVWDGGKNGALGHFFDI